MNQLKQKIKEQCSIFSYEKPEFPADCLFNISPSQIEKFFSAPVVWYQDNLTDKGKSFEGNTATVIGTICHHIYEEVTLGRHPDREEINRQLAVYASLIPELELDINQIIIDYPLVAECVVNNYVLPHNTQGKIQVEKKVIAKVLPGIYVGGSCDRIEGMTVVDYKTVAAKPNETILPFGYQIQLGAYAYALRANGYNIDSIRVVYGVKPTKTLGARCYVVTQMIDYKLDKMISDTLKLIGESVLAVKENPNLAYLIFKSYNLKLE